MRRLFAISFFFFSLTAYAQKLKQGIRGQVYWTSGNQMPGPGVKPSPQLGVQREIFIYELVSLKDCEQKDGFFTSVSSRLITTALSKPDGAFKIKLPPGRYSVFVKEPKGLFANSFDKNSFINPITVIERRFAPVTILINYQAAY